MPNRNQFSIMNLVDDPDYTYKRKLEKLAERNNQSVKFTVSKGGGAGNASKKKCYFLAVVKVNVFFCF